MRGDVLFWGGDLDSALRNREKQVREHVESVSESQLSDSVEELVSRIVKDFEVPKVVLYEDKKELEREEIEVDVSGNADRNPFRGRGPINVPGVRIRVFIPFQGERDLFSLKPNTWTSVLPHGEVRSPESSWEIDGELVLTFEKPADDDFEKIKAEVEKEINLVKNYLKNQESQIDDFNQGLRGKVGDLVAQRKERLKKQEGISDSLGITERKK